MKKSLIVMILAIGFVFTVSPADARRQKGISVEDVKALKNIGIDLRYASSAEINQKAAAIERLVHAIKSLSEARILEAKARQEEAKAVKAELKLQKQLQKAGYTQQKSAAKQQKIDAKNDPLNPYERTFSKETNKTFRDFLNQGRRELMREVFR